MTSVTFFPKAEKIKLFIVTGSLFSYQMIKIICLAHLEQKFKRPFLITHCRLSGNPNKELYLEMYVMRNRRSEQV